MHTFLLQDWVTITGDHSGNATVGTITQDGSQWLDLEAYQDLGIWFEISAVTGSATATVQLAFETSPTRDDSTFFAMRTFSLTNGNNGTGVSSALAANIGSSVSTGQTSIPLARWVRWKATQTAGGSVAWSITFRILISGTTYQ